MKWVLSELSDCGVLLWNTHPHSSHLLHHIHFLPNISKQFMHKMVLWTAQRKEEERASYFLITGLYRLRFITKFSVQESTEEKERSSSFSSLSTSKPFSVLIFFLSASHHHHPLKPMTIFHRWVKVKEKETFCRAAPEESFSFPPILHVCHSFHLNKVACRRRTRSYIFSWLAIVSFLGMSIKRINY